MPLVLLAFAVLIGVASYNNELDELWSLIQTDLGNGEFLAAFFVLAILYFASYSPALKKPALLFGVLIILGVFLKAGGGTFSQIQQAVSNPQAPAAQTATPVPTGSIPISISGSAGSGSYGGASSAIGGAFSSILDIFGL